MPRVRAPIPARLAAAVAVAVAVATVGCTTGTAPKPAPSTTSSGRTRSTGPESAPPGRGGSIAARIRLPVPAFSVATGEGSVWALTRRPRPAVWRIDPSSNRVVGTPTRLPVDPWSIAVGAGSVWVTPNGADGRLIRIDPRTGRISARISARPVYFGSVIAFGAGFVWTGNDDERYEHGSTITKLDPRTGRVVGKPLVLGSPQSVAFGHGAVWVADHTGWLLKIAPGTLRIVARKRLDFGPHGVAVTDAAVYVADAHGSRLLEADPRTARIRRVVRLPIGPIYPAVGAGSIWSSSAAVWGTGTTQATLDDRVVRIDPRTLAVAETFHLGGNVSAVAFGFGSLWAAQAAQVVRITPRAGA
jgi:hypothetical protein